MSKWKGLILRPPTIRGIMFAVAVLVVLAFTPIGRWVILPAPPAGEVALDRRLGEVRIEDMPLQEAIRAIAQQAGAKVIIHWDALYRDVPIWGRVNLRLRNVTAREAIEGAFASCGVNVDSMSIESAGAQIEVGMYQLNVPAMNVRLYEIDHLIDPDFAPAPRNGVPSKSRHQMEEDLSRAIGGWDGQWAGTRRTSLNRTGRMTIQRSPAMHRHISQVIEALSSPMTIRSEEDRRKAFTGVLPGLQTRVADLDLKEVSLHEAIERLKERAWIDLVLPADIQRTRRFSLHVRNTTAEQALDMILTLASSESQVLKLRYRDNQFVTIVPAMSDEGGVLVAYDVREIINSITRADDQHHNADEPPGSQSPMARERAMTVLLETVGARQWLDPNGGNGLNIQAINGRLLVRQPPANQRRLLNSIELLRRSFLTSGDVVSKGQSGSPAREKIIGDAADSERNVRSLKEMPLIPELRLEGVTILEGLKQLNAISHVGFILDVDEVTAGDIDWKAPIHLTAHDVSLPDAIRMAFDAVSPPGTVRISKKEARRGLLWIGSGPEPMDETIFIDPRDVSFDNDSAGGDS